VAVVNPPTIARHPKAALAAALAAVAVAVAVMWGPVARGLHEESIVRWCSAAQGIAPSQIDFETRAHVSACVEQALTDPGYMTALRASL
jgi:hypothetical protein